VAVPHDRLDVALKMVGTLGFPLPPVSELSPPAYFRRKLSYCAMGIAIVEDLLLNTATVSLSFY
jgi:hypothetical protein